MVQFRGIHDLRPAVILPDIIRPFKINRIMYNKQFLKNRILLAKLLTELYSDPGNRDKGEKFVSETYGKDFLGIGYGAFLNCCSNHTDVGPDDEVAPHIEAAARSLGRNLEMIGKLKNKEIELWQIPLPEYKDLVDTIRARMRKDPDWLEKIRRQETDDRPQTVTARREKVPVGQH